MFKVKKIILFVFILFVKESSLFAQEKNDSVTVNYEVVREYEIGGVTVSGIKYLNSEILVTISGLQVGNRIKVPGQEIQKAIQNLWKQGLFSNVEIYVTRFIDDKVFLEIELQERARLSSYTFRGIKKSDADEIRDKIKLVKGKSVTENLKMYAANTIKDYFIGKGFINTQVKVIENIDTTTTNSVSLLIEIEKGDKIKVEKIIFDGTQNVSIAKLKKSMKSTKEKAKVSIFHTGIFNKINFRRLLPKRFFTKSLLNTSDYSADIIRPNFFTTSKFKKEDFETDKIKIIEYYNSKGFRNAKIVSDTTFITNKKDLNIVMKIDEGNKFYFRNITWNGNTKYPSSRLSEILGIKKGDIYDHSLLESRLTMNPNGTDVSSLYMDDGYLFFNVTPVEILVENDSIDIEMRVYEGSQATINKVIIAGNTRTNEHVIRRELRTLPGEKFSRSDIIRSQREIASLNFFDPEKIGISPQPHPEDGTVDIEYNLEEKSSDQLQFQAGWGAGRVIGTVSVVFNNFSIKNIGKKEAWSPLPSGDGQKLSLSVQSTGTYYQSINTSFTEPWLGGKKPNSLTVSFYRSWLSNGVTRKKEKEDTALQRQSFITTGAALGYGIRLKWPDDYFQLHSSLNFQNFKLNHYRTSGFSFTDGISNNFSIKLALVRNSIDQPIYPRQGSNLTLSVQFTPPYTLFRRDTLGNIPDYPNMAAQDKYKWLEYHKWRFDYEWFTKIAGDLVLKTGAKFGFLGFYNQKLGMSPFERFDVGGDGISNYTFYGKDIIALRGYEPSHITPYSEGATIFNKYTLELRYPVVLKPMSTIYATMFLEGGNTWLRFRDFNPLEVKRAAGVGLRMFLPMFGLLGFDYGIGFDRNDVPIGSKFGRYAKFSFILGFEPE